MNPLRRLGSRLSREEGGWTLIEMLVASALGLVVVGTCVMIFTATLKSEPRAASRGGDIQNARFTMEQLTRELRQGSSVPVATSTQLSIVTYVQSATCGGAAATTALSCRVTYNCSTGTCTRTEANPDGSGGGPARQVVTGLASSNVFSYTPSAADPSFIGLNFSFPADNGDDSITLRDGVSLRNPEAD